MELTTTWKEEGRWAEALSLTLRLLTRRFGPLAPDLEERSGKLSLLQLEQLFDAAYDFTSIADLQTWLDNNPPDERDAGTQSSV